MGSVSVGAAFLAGLASFVSPCVLPMLPTFLLVLAGSSVGAGETRGDGDTGRRRILLGNTLAFLAGFAMVFLVMGATATAVGQFALAHWKTLEKAGGIVLLVLGAFLSGIWTPAFLLRERRPFLQQGKRGALGSFSLGAAFTLGWTPCTGPILTAILLYAGSRQTLTEGVLLLAAYTAGFAVPFLLAVLLWDRIGPGLRRLYPWLPGIQKALGAFLMVFGLLMLSGLTLRLLGILSSWTALGARSAPFFVA